MRNRVSVVTICCLSLANFALAGDAIEVPIWPGVAPGSAGSTLKEEYRDRPITDGTDTARDRHVSGVTEPTLSVYLSDATKKANTLVIVCPGGGFNILAIDKEGHDVARWLQAQGIAGAVVKYRLPDPDLGVNVSNGSIRDVQRAIRIVRHNAAAWNIDPRRIGVTGFSAGGYLTAAVGTLFDEGNPKAEDPIRRQNCRPDFIAPIYPLVSLEIERERRDSLLQRMLGTPVTDKAIGEYSLDRRVTARTPPTFLVHAHDDRLSADHSVRFYLALRREGVSAELHVYSQGGHGFGIRQRAQPISGWPNRWLEWMRNEALVETPQD